MSEMDFANDAEIKHASEIFLPKGCCFINDDEKKAIIRCNESRDIEACPGSGKTTTLLAKLLILANRMPLEGNKGICVLTHTNVAIDEIKEKLGSKADVLFRYPNHFGTIQSFVDKFLAIPYFRNNKDEFNEDVKSVKIEFEYYKHALLKDYRNNFPGNLKYGLGLKFEDKVDELLVGMCYDPKDSSNLLWGINGNKIPYSAGCKTYLSLKNLKDELYKKGTLKFEDAFLLANKSLDENKKLALSFNERFKYVFIDEMQDTAQHQIDILDKVFDYENTIVQRFGDPNQAIYNKVSLDKVWNPRNPLPINLSRRFGENIATVLKTVCIEDNSDLIASKDVGSLSPIMIVFEDPLDVLPKYCELVLEKETEYKGDKLTVFEISKREGKPIKAVGWVGNELDKNKPNRFKLNSYFDGYHKEVKKKEKVDYRSLKSFLRKIENVKAKDYSDRIIEAMLQILRLDGITYEKNGRNYYYTKTSFLKALSDNQLQEKFQKKCSKWIRKIHISESFDEEIIEKVRKFFVKHLFPTFNVKENNPEVRSFLNAKLEDNMFSNEVLEAGNCYIYDGKEDLKVEVSNIHQVKGETHTATLYLETYYQGKCESEAILDQLLGNVYVQPKKKKDTYTKETLKMAYVGMSRPRYLLCMAIHKDRFDEKLDKDNGGLWKIVKTYED